MESIKRLFTRVASASVIAISSLSYAVDYDIVYVKQPRHGDDQHINWPEVFEPARVEQGSDLMLLKPDGSEEVLVDTEYGAVTDPFVSFDGKWIYYSYFPDVRPEALNSAKRRLPYQGADIYKINVETREIIQLTNQEFTPNTGNGVWDVGNPVNPGNGYNAMGYGVMNMSPVPLAGGKIMFTSNRNGFVPTKGFTTHTMQLFVMDENGANVTPIAPMTLGSALHPVPLKNGEVMFSTYESQGLRDVRLWGVWKIWPDGRNWTPVISAFKAPSALHFQTERTDGTIVIGDYYNKNNFGFGGLFALPTLNPGEIAFNDASVEDNPTVTETKSGNTVQTNFPFMNTNMKYLTPLASATDNAATEGYGKYTHPSGAPNNDLLVAWSDGPVNRLNRPTPLPAVDSGIYVIENGEEVYNVNQLKLIKNDPNYNEAWPRAVVPYQDIYGVPEPTELEWLPNDGTVHAALPEGTPYGLIGTSSFYKRESFPGLVSPYANTYDGLDAFNTKQNGQSGNWVYQGADAGKYDNSDIHAVRLVAMEPNVEDSQYPSDSQGKFFYNHANERLRILGEIPLRKYNADNTPVLDPEGNPDTSFLAKIPADTPFTFQTLDRNGMVLNSSQTWHQVRPGEQRTDCGGCHSHSQEPLKFEDTEAAKPGYEIWDLMNNTTLVSQDNGGNTTLRTVEKSLVDVEFYQDIRPILQQSCTSCHSQSVESPPADLVLDDYTKTSGLPNDYQRLCHDERAQWGIQPIIDTTGLDIKWRQANASRYVRKFQSRRSLLMWKLFGKRMDGWNNEDHPSAAILGDVTSLPEGANPNHADLDYIGSIMPVPDSGVPALTNEQKIVFARWIDLGCPIDIYPGSEYGWFSDEIRPTLTLTYPKAGHSTQSLETIMIGLVDANTGVDINSLSVTANFPIDGYAADTELKDIFSATVDGVLTYHLVTPITQLDDGFIKVSVADNDGNINEIKRIFAINGEISYQGPAVINDFEPNRINGTNANDAISGTEGIDEIHGLGGADTIVGGLGDDLLIGGASNDTYYYGKGDGNDTIHDESGWIDTLVFTEGITPEDITLTVENNEFTITISDGSVIALQDWHADNGIAIEQFTFQNGETELIWNRATIALHTTIIGTHEQDELNYLASIVGFTYHGKMGDDYISGGIGHDSYLYNLNDGNDTIHDAAGWGDKLVLGAALTPENMRIEIQSDVMQFIMPNEQRVTVYDWHQLDTLSIDELVFTDQELDGLIWNESTIASNTTVVGEITNDIIDYSSIKHGFVYDLNEGNDNVIGGKSHDTYIYNVGDGEDTIRDLKGWNDKLEFGAGITPENINIEVENGVYTILTPNQGKIILEDWYQNNRVAIETFKFTDTEWNTGLIAANTHIIGTSGDDLMDYASALSGFSFKAGGGTDTILSTKKNDTIYFNIGDGMDTVTERGGWGDKVIFGADITPNNIKVTADNDNLVIELLVPTGDKLTIISALANSSNVIESYQFDGYPPMTASQMAALIN